MVAAAGEPCLAEVSVREEAEALQLGEHVAELQERRQGSALHHELAHQALAAVPARRRYLLPLPRSRLEIPTLYVIMCISPCTS